MRSFVCSSVSKKERIPFLTAAAGRNKKRFWIRSLLFSKNARDKKSSFCRWEFDDWLVGEMLVHLLFFIYFDFHLLLLAGWRMAARASLYVHWREIDVRKKEKKDKLCFGALIASQPASRIRRKIFLFGVILYFVWQCVCARINPFSSHFNDWIRFVWYVCPYHRNADQNNE